MFGWMREPFIASLLAADLPCPESLRQPEPYRPHVTPPPGWAKPFMGRRHIPLYQAARVLAGVDPTDESALPDDIANTAFEWDAALRDAVEDNEIELAEGEDRKRLN